MNYPLYPLQRSAIWLGMLCLIGLMTACGGGQATKPDTPPAKTSTKPPTKGGGYYLDDGPGDNPPNNIDGIPDATPRAEPLLPRVNRPYTALGQRYVPMTSYAPYKKQGIASWYGRRYHGKMTSSGEIYDMYAMSGAHPTLPLPSYVRVTNPANGRSVIVRINDRGPFKHDRLIDLSYAAAYKLRLTSQGSGLVEVEAIDTSSQAWQKQSTPVTQTSPASASPTTATPAAAVSPATINPTGGADDDNTRAASTPSLTITPTLSNPSAIKQYYVQAGAFKNEANGDLLQKKIQGLQLAENVGLVNVYNNGLYRVRLGPYASKTEADSSAAQIRKQLNISAIVQLQ